jgi:hypothetical protein
MCTTGNVWGETNLWKVLYRFFFYQSAMECLLNISWF